MNPLLLLETKTIVKVLILYLSILLDTTSPSTSFEVFIVLRLPAIIIFEKNMNDNTCIRIKEQKT